MTLNDYKRLRDLIEDRFRHDMAAIERVFFIANGVNPPGAIADLAGNVARREKARKDVDERVASLGDLDEIEKDAAAGEDAPKRKYKPRSAEAQARAAERVKARLAARHAEPPV